MLDSSNPSRASLTIQPTKTTKKMTTSNKSSNKQNSKPISKPISKMHCPIFNLTKKMSTIPNSGYGVFALERIPKSSYLGVYLGRQLSIKQFLNGVLANKIDPNYAFDVNSGDQHFILDATNPELSNWTRYMNCSRNDSEENVCYRDSGGKIKFYAARDIEPNEELLFYYGEVYANKLGIDYQSKYY